MITNGKPRQIRITKIHPADAFYEDSDELIGLTGKFIPAIDILPGYFCGVMVFDKLRKGLQTLVFHAIRYIRI